MKIVRPKIKKSKNGFTLVEVIAALMVFALALGGITELFRLGLGYRKMTEETARTLEAAQLIKRLVEANISDAPRDQIGVSDKTLRLNGIEIMRLSSAGENPSPPNVAQKAKLSETIVSIYKISGRQTKLSRTIKLQTNGLVFRPNFDVEGHLTQIVIGRIGATNSNKSAFMPLALAALEVTGPRPCVFDSQIGACGEFDQ